MWKGSWFSVHAASAITATASIPNIIAMYILAPEVKKDLKAYCQKYKVGKLVNRGWIAEAETQPIPIPVEIIEDEEKSLGESSWQTK